MRDTKRGFANRRSIGRACMYAVAHRCSSPALLMHTQTSPTRVWRASSLLRGCFFIVVNRSLPFPPSVLPSFLARIFSRDNHSIQLRLFETKRRKFDVVLVFKGRIFRASRITFIQVDEFLLKKTLPPLMAPEEVLTTTVFCIG